jgi:hypothetical protein
MVNTQEGHKAVTIYEAVHRGGPALMGKKIGIGTWDLTDGKLTITSVNDRIMQATAFHNAIEVLLTDYSNMMPDVLAVGYWKITEGFSTGAFTELTDVEIDLHNQLSS